MNLMTFHVGPWDYALVIQGNRNYCSAVDRCIYIATWVPPSRRLEVLAHELRHAWGNHVPRSRDEEDEAILSSTVIAECIGDLRKQGGEQTLRAMRPAEPQREITYEPLNELGWPER